MGNLSLSTHNYKNDLALSIPFSSTTHSTSQLSPAAAAAAAAAMSRVVSPNSLSLGVSLANLVPNNPTNELYREYRRGVLPSALAPTPVYVATTQPTYLPSSALPIAHQVNPFPTG